MNVPLPAVSTIAWCALVGLGVGAILIFQNRGDKQGPVAARALPKNTLVLSGDLTNPGFTGRYVVAPDGIKKDATLRLQDVADQPLLPEAPPVKLLLSLPIARSAMVGGVNAGSTMQLCGKAPLSFGAVTIHTIGCDRAAANCSAVVELPSSAAADFAVKGLKDQTSAGELRLAASCEQ